MCHQARELGAGLAQSAALALRCYCAHHRRLVGTGPHWEHARVQWLIRATAAHVHLCLQIGRRRCEQPNRAGWGLPRYMGKTSPCPALCCCCLLLALGCSPAVPDLQCLCCLGLAWHSISFSYSVPMITNTLNMNFSPLDQAVYSICYIRRRQNYSGRGKQT